MPVDFVLDAELSVLTEHYRIMDIALEKGGEENIRRIYRRGRLVGSSVYHASRVPRLMEIARQVIRDEAARGRDFPSGTVFWADSLTGARGRLSRTWWAPEGGIYLCLVIFPVLLQEHWHFYSMGAGVALAQILREWGVDARIRWVNDVLVHGRKVAGILTETYPSPGGEGSFILIGLGLNVNIRDFPAELPQAGSLSLATGLPWPLRPLIAHILARTGWIFGSIEDWEARGLDEDGMPGVRTDRLNPVIRAWNLVSSTPGQRVAYGMDADNRPEFYGLAHGLDPKGGLRIRMDSGEMVTVWSGEVRHLGRPPEGMLR